MASKKTKTLIDILSNWCQTHTIVASRESLLAAIICGDVQIGSERCRDAQKQFSATLPITLSENSPLGRGQTIPSNSMNDVPGLPYVSRGGNKLFGVLEAWQVPVAGRVWLDAGCSTGGFSHCLLLGGATRIHAVDVGYNVIDWRLRNLDKLIVHERTNIMSLVDLSPPPNAAVADLSFRSIEGAARAILAMCTDNELYALIKPQFERKHRRTQSSPHEFSGVVHADETFSILEDLAERLGAEGVCVQRIMKAGLKGRTGNQEFIAQLTLGNQGSGFDPRLAHANKAVIKTL